MVKEIFAKSDYEILSRITLCILYQNVWLIRAKQYLLGSEGVGVRGRVLWEREGSGGRGE
jgi:hypothetical protein